MIYYTIVNNETHFEYIIKLLTSQGFYLPSNITWKKINSSAGLSEPALFYSDGDYRRDITYGHILFAEGHPKMYTRKDIKHHIIPEDMFVL